MEFRIAAVRAVRTALRVLRVGCCLLIHLLEDGLHFGGKRLECGVVFLLIVGVKLFLGLFDGRGELALQEIGRAAGRERV